MKKRNLFIMSLAMFVAVITLSSWKLFGREYEPPTFDGQNDANICYESSLEDRYFLGFRIQNDVPVKRRVDCKSGEVLGGWVPSGQ